MDTVINIIGAACAGAALQEIIYWYGQRERFSGINSTNNNDNENTNWIIYWAITISMVIGSGIGTYYWFVDRLDTTSLRDALITGAAFPSLLKITVQSYLKTNKPITRMGAKQTKTGLIMYFGGRR